MASLTPAKWALADELALEYPGTDPQKLLIVKNNAINFFDKMMEFDTETGSIRFEADYD